MRPLIPLRARNVALTTALASGAILLGIGLPTRAQQNLPALRLTLPASVTAGAPARVQYMVTLPPGLALARNPRVKVLDDKGNLWELLPMFITQRTPAVTGYRDLHSENYPPGVYHVSIEADTIGASSQESTVASPPVTLTLSSP